MPSDPTAATTGAERIRPAAGTYYAMHMPRLLPIAMVLLLMAATLGGCASYTLRGKVIEGSMDAIMVVDEDDSRLAEPGLREARIHLYRDPGRLAQKLVATGTSAPDGSIAIPVEEFGAGWMDEQWSIAVSRSGFRSVSETLRLPTGRKRLLIMLSRGRSTPFDEDDDLWEEYRRYR